MPSRMVMGMDRPWRPGTTSRATAPAINPTTMMLMMSPSMGMPFCDGPVVPDAGLVAATTL